MNRKTAGTVITSGLLSFVRSVDFPYFPGAIYPSEMAFFLYHCEEAGIDCIIESGRSDGYSTAVIGAYGEARAIRVVSIDVEADRNRAMECRKRLGRYTDLELIVGDTFYELPRILGSVRGKIALLIDGPKYSPATYLSAAATAYGPVRIIAHHNVSPEYTHLCSHFLECFSDARRLEGSELYQSLDFTEFRKWETRITEDYRGPGRDLEKTSLVVSVLPRTGPDREYLWKSSVRHMLSTTTLFLWWKAGCPGWRAIHGGIRLGTFLKS